MGKSDRESVVIGGGHRAKPTPTVVKVPAPPPKPTPVPEPEAAPADTTKPSRRSKRGK